MTLTRANVETVIVARVGGRLTAAGLDGTTTDGTNADLADPIAYAVRQSGGTVAAATVADADLLTVDDSAVDVLLDLAEVRALETALGNLAEVDWSELGLSVKMSQLSTQLERMIAARRTAIARTYGTGTLTAGVINLGFMQAGPTS